ncbi:hypothetical protein D3C80_1787570 [compost metagenome]
MTRSQAEDIIAAERAMRKTAEQRLAQSQEDLKQARADNAALTARVKAVPYHLSEIEGCLEEYIAMPCSSLRARLLGAIATARATLEAKP